MVWMTPFNVVMSWSMTLAPFTLVIPVTTGTRKKSLTHPNVKGTSLSTHPWHGRCIGFRNRERRLSGNLEDRMCRSNLGRRDVEAIWSIWPDLPKCCWAQRGKLKRKPCWLAQTPCKVRLEILKFSVELINATRFYGRKKKRKLPVGLASTLVSPALSIAETSVV